jgi:hypothetical protein
MTLAEPRRYFPIAGTYSMPGGQPRLGTSGYGDRYIEADLQLDHYRKAKAAVAACWAPCRASGMEKDERTAAQWLRDKIDRDCPDLLARSGASELALLDDLVSLIQEDLVIMRKSDNASPAAAATADYLHVCFPSNWCPSCILGKTFDGIHQSVPESGSFTFAQRRGRAGTLFASAPTARFVWTLMPDSHLDHRKCHAAAKHGTVHAASWRDSGDTAFLRVERQIIAPIDDRLSVFLIRTYLYPVESLTANERRLLRASIDSMSFEVASYKGFADDRGDNREGIGARLMRSGASVGKRDKSHSSPGVPMTIPFGTCADQSRQYVGQQSTARWRSMVVRVAHTQHATGCFQQRTVPPVMAHVWTYPSPTTRKVPNNRRRVDRTVGAIAQLAGEAIAPAAQAAVRVGACVCVAGRNNGA